VETPTANLTGVVDETGTVCIDRTCLKCGYNLRGLDRAGRCPECATPVGLSIHGDLLCYAEPGYVNKLARGSRWIMRGLTLALLCIILFAGAMVVATASAWSGLADSLLTAGVILLVLGVFAGVVMLLLGVWFITAPLPYVFDTGRQDRNRRLVRIYMLAAFLGIALSIIVEELGPPPRVMAVFEFFLLGFSVLGVVGTAAYFLYLRELARRIADESPNSQEVSVRTASRLAKGLAVTLGLMVLLEAVDTVIVWGPVLVAPGASAPAPAAIQPTGPATPANGWLTVLRFCLGTPAALALLVLFLMAVHLHHSLRKAFAQQATLAAQHWGQALVPVARPIA